MTKTKLTKKVDWEKLLTPDVMRTLSGPFPPMDMSKLKAKYDHEENLSAGVGLLVLLIVFLLGNLLGHWVSNKLRPTWHSPKGCPLFVQQEGR